MAFGTSGRPSFGSPTTNPSAILGQADQLRQQGRMAEAESLVRGLVAVQPNSPIALNVLALLVRGRGDYNEAESLFHRAIAAAPNVAELHNNLGNVLASKEDPKGAESAYRKAIALKSDYPEAWNNLGLALRDQGQSELAIAALRRALSLRPNYTQAQAQLGALLIEADAIDEALVHLRPAAANSNSYDAHYYLGVALNVLERPDESIPILQKAVELAPARHEARFALANAFTIANRELEALRAYQATFECKPDFLPALYDYTALAWSMGNGMNSLESYAYARGRVGDTPDLLLAEGNLRMRLNDATEAETLLRRAYEMAPERADVANGLGRAMMLQTRFDESYPLLQQAIAAQPDALSHHHDLGEAFLKGRHFGEAKRVFRDALALSPHDQTALACLALALRELGDSDYAALMNRERFVREYEIAPPPGFSDLAVFNRALAAELERMHTRTVEPIDQTLRHGTQTTGALFDKRNPVIEALRERIREAVADYIANMPDDAAHPLLSRKSSEFSFAGSWSCRLNSAGFHTNHIHNEGWLSSAYYVSLPPAVAAGDGGQGALKFEESQFYLSERDRPSHFVKPAVGKLVLFPSYFWHGTVPFQAPDMRMTVAFDVTPGPAVRRPSMRSSY